MEYRIIHEDFDLQLATIKGPEALTFMKRHFPVGDLDGNHARGLWVTSEKLYRILARAIVYADDDVTSVIRKAVNIALPHVRAQEHDSGYADRIFETMYEQHRQESRAAFELASKNWDPSDCIF